MFEMKKVGGLDGCEGKRRPSRSNIILWELSLAVI